MPDFKEWLVERGCVERYVQDCVDAITHFCRYHHAENPQVWLGRLCSVHRVSRERLLLPPQPWDWLAEFQEGKVRDKAHDAYVQLLDFLEDILLDYRGQHSWQVAIRGQHITLDESRWRQEQLREIEREALAHHPAKEWARDQCRPETCGYLARQSRR